MSKEKTTKLNIVGQPEPATGQPVDRFHPDRVVGERQDGPGAGPREQNRADDVPAGSTAAQRGGPGDPAQAGAHGPAGEEPDAEHRGQPALFKSGAASGSGSAAGGSGHGGTEEPAADSAGGGGREAGFAADRPLPDTHGDGRKHGGR